MATALFMVAVGLWSTVNADFLNTKNEQVKQGMMWHQIECRPPNEELPHISMETPIGNKYVCFKLKPKG